jgi:hypothetical protein
VLGLGALATGAVFGLQAKSTLSDARQHCSPYPYCSPRGQELGEQAERSATLSTVLFVAGGARLVAFTALWLTAPSKAREPERVAVVVSPFAVGIAGSL